MSKNCVIDFEGKHYTRIDSAALDSAPLDWWSSQLNRVNSILRPGLRQGIQSPFLYRSRDGDALAVTFVRLPKTLNANLGLVKGAIRVFGAVEIDGNAHGFLAVCVSDDVARAVF